MTGLREQARRWLACRRPLVCVLVVGAVLAAPLLAGCADATAGDASAGQAPRSRAASPAETPSPRVASPRPDSSARPSPEPPMLPPAQAVLVLGDSLALGLYPYLAAQLPDRMIEYDAAVGTSTAWALGQLQRRAHASTVDPVLVVSAGTNDSTDNVAGWRRQVERILTAAGPQRCVVWPTIARPASRGGDAKLFNRVLNDVAMTHPNLAVVDWAGLVQRHPGWLIADHVHGTTAGMTGRAQAIAEAVTQCSPLDPMRRVGAQPRPSTWGQPGPSPTAPGASTTRRATPSATASASPAATRTATAQPSPSPTNAPAPTKTSTPSPEPTSDPSPSATASSDPPPPQASP